MAGEQLEVVWNGTIDRQAGGLLSSPLCRTTDLRPESEQRQPFQLTLAGEEWPPMQTAATVGARRGRVPAAAALSPEQL